MNPSVKPLTFYQDSRMTGIILKVTLSVLLLCVVAYGVLKAIQYSRITATPKNIQGVKISQITNLEKRWVGITQAKQGLTTEIKKIPDDQQLLINATVFSTRLTGYLGPHQSGVFDEDTATRIALSSGSRCLILEIDREMNQYEPKLIYRDGWGIKQSLNFGSIKKVAKSIAERAFTTSNDGVPPSLSNDPLFVVIYFVSTPDAVKNPLEYVRFMAKVAEELQPLKDYCIAQTPQGDFRRQALESQLFFTKYSVFAGKIVLLTNADTTPFRRLDSLGLGGEIGGNQDLDLLVHARLYSRESPSGLGISASPPSNIKAHALITTPSYWINTPPDRLGDAQNQTKSAWTLVMPPSASEANTISSDGLTKLLTQYGAQSIPLCLFDKTETTNLFTGKDAPFEKVSWVIKPELIRFIPPKPIIVKTPIPETNSGGGTVVTPDF